MSRRVASERINMSVSAPAQLPVQGSLLRGKRGVIMGVANDRSLAWGIASACAAQGAELAFTFQGEALERRVRPLAAQVGSDLVLPCDVSDEASIDQAFGMLAQRWDRLDFLVHAIGFADKQYLRGRYLDTPRAAFLQAMDISCYSFTAVCQRAVPMMQPGGSLLTLSYLGAERVVPHYNVMGVAKAALEASVRYLAADLGSAGIRCNGISAGPIKTLAASGIGDFRYILRWNQLNSPMRRNVTIEEVGGAGLYLLSDLSSGVTGEVHHVDCGYHTVGMKHPDAPDIATAEEKP
jgi:enoyl-[acyl-carrier protein] reductase I